MTEIKQCPVCWGKKVVCVGLRDSLEPILEPCTGCDGTGHIAYKVVDKDKIKPLNRAGYVKLN